MTSSRNDTGEGSGPGKVSTETRPRRRLRIVWLPVLTSIPMIAGALFLAFRYGPVIRKLLGILIKMVVKA